MCVVGNRVVIPVKGRKHALDMLRETNPGIVRLKALARAYLWWPSVLCNECQSLRNTGSPTRPDRPW
jgi:hypothetical protein